MRAELQERNVAYLGFESGFEAGKAIAIDFTGNNLPMIGLFLDDAPETVKIGGVKDAGTGIIFTNCNPLWSLGRLIGVGPYRLYSSDETHSNNVSSSKYISHTSKSLVLYRPSY